VRLALACRRRLAFYTTGQELCWTDDRLAGMMWRAG
jgi:hypothetical protein